MPGMDTGWGGPPSPEPPPAAAHYSPRTGITGRAQRKLGKGKGEHKGSYRAGQTALTENGAEGGKGRDKRERNIVVVRSPCQENDPADAHTSTLKSVPESANPAWTRSVHLHAPGQRHGQQPVSGTPGPGVVKQDKSSRGSADTTKIRLDPQRVGMCSGERPMGAAKGKQTNTMASCHTPPPL